jgi:hypothetical protein
MNKYIVLSPLFWEDSIIAGLTGEQRYLMIYLMTSSYSNQCGIMLMDKETIALETGFSKGTVEILLRELELIGEIITSEETQELMLLNMLYYIPMGNETMQQCIAQELYEVKNNHFIELFLKVGDKIFGNKA